MPDNDQRAEDKAKYQELLAHWEKIGFIQSGWSVTWDEGDGAHRVSFFVGKRMYVLTEAAFDFYVIGVADMGEFLKPRKSDERARLAELVAWLEEEHGPVPPEIRAQFDVEWPTGERCRS